MAARFGYTAPMVPRTNFPKVNANYTIPATDMGAVATAVGITITLPLIATAQLDGDPYCVKNVSGGNINIVPSGSDVFTTGSGNQTTESIYTESDQDFRVSTSDSTWILL